MRQLMFVLQVMSSVEELPVMQMFVGEGGEGAGGERWGGGGLVGGWWWWRGERGERGAN